MKIRDFVRIFDQIVNSDANSILELAKNPDTQKDFIAAVGQLSSYSESAKEIIVGRLDEEGFVKFMLLIEKMATAMMFVNDDVDKAGIFSLLQAASRGTLQEYTHSVVMAVVGALIDEEVL